MANFSRNKICIRVLRHTQIPFSISLALSHTRFSSSNYTKQQQRPNIDEERKKPMKREKNLSLHSYLFVLYHAQFNVHTLSYLSSCIDSAGSNFDVFFRLNAVFFFYQNSDLNDSLTWVFFTIRRVFLWFHRNSYDVVDISSLFTHWICVWCFFLLFCLLLFLFSSFRLLASFHSHSRWTFWNIILCCLFNCFTLEILVFFFCYLNHLKSNRTQKYALICCNSRLFVEWRNAHTLDIP